MFAHYEEKIRKQKVEVGLLALCAFIYRQMRKGVDKSTISQMLAASGMNLTDATELVEKVQAEITMLGEGQGSHMI